MSNQSTIQLDSSKLLGFKQLRPATNGKVARRQAMVGVAKIGTTKKGLSVRGVS